MNVKIFLKNINLKINNFLIKIEILNFLLLKYR